MVKTKKASTSKVSKVPAEKTLVKAGIALVILGIISSIFYAYTNQRFMHSIITDIFYYLNYAVVLGGGFAVGYLFTTRKGNGAGGNKAFNGVVYAFITTSLYFMIDALRTISINVFGGPSGYIDGILFGYSALLGVAFAVFLAYYLQSRSKKSVLSSGSKRALIISFLAVQSYYLIETIYYVLVPPVGLDSGSWPLWMTVVSYLTHPVVLALIAFLALTNIKGIVQRLFYATFISAFAYILNLVLWNFRTDPSMESTGVFQIIMFVLMLAVTGGLILQVRHSK